MICFDLFSFSVSHKKSFLIKVALLVFLFLGANNIAHAQDQTPNSSPNQVAFFFKKSQPYERPAADQYTFPNQQSSFGERTKDYRRRDVVDPGQKSAVKVGILLPLSGDDAALGKALLDAAQLAVFEIAQGNFVLMPFDTKGTPEGAREAARRALYNEVEIILGPLFSKEVTAVAPEARRSWTNVVAFTNDRTVAGNGVYIMGMLPQPQIMTVLAQAQKQGINKIAALVPDNTYGGMVIEAMQRAESVLGVEIVEVHFYDTTSSDISPSVQQLAHYGERKHKLSALKEELAASGRRKELKRLGKTGAIGDLPYQAIIVPDGGARLRNIAPMLSYYDIDTSKIQLLGTVQWEAIAKQSELSLIGGWYAASPPEAYDGFMKRYEQAFGRKAPRLATIAYDATALAAVLARNTDRPDFSDAALTALNGFAGVDGIFRFSKDGLIDRGFAILEVTKDGPKTFMPAPKTFDNVVN